MGLTQEMWFCAGDWLSRLDVTTCPRQIYKKYYCAPIVHILSLQDRHESTTVVPIEINKKGVVNGGTQRTSHNSHSILLVTIVY